MTVINRKRDVAAPIVALVAVIALVFMLPSLQRNRHMGLLGIAIVLLLLLAALCFVSIFFMARKIVFDKQGVAIFLGKKEICRYAWEQIQEVGVLDYAKKAGLNAYIYFSPKPLSVLMISFFMFAARFRWTSLPACVDQSDLRAYIGNYYHGEIRDLFAEQENVGQ